MGACVVVWCPDTVPTLGLRNGQATGEGGWSDNKPQDHEDMGTRPYKLFGNPETMNMNPLLINNIKVSA